MGSEFRRRLPAVELGSNRRRVGVWDAMTVITVAVGLAVRIWILVSPAGRLDSDEAVVGLMGQWVSEGHKPPLFFWGQYYGGTIEPVLVAVGMKLHHGRMLVKAVPLAMSALSALILVRAARQLMTTQRARLAGALLFAWPGTTWLATKERGFYWVGMVLVCTALYAAARIVSNTSPLTRIWALYGFTVGLAWYTTAQTMFVLLPLTVWLVTTRFTIRSTAILLATSLIGAAPWFVGWARYGSRVFEQATSTSPYFDRLETVSFTLIPRALGLRTLFVSGWTLGPVGAAIWITAFTAAIGIAIYGCRFRRRLTPFTPALIILLICFPFLAAVPSLSIFASEPRYGLYIIPVVALGLMNCIRSPRGAAVLLVSALSVGIISTSTLVTMSRAESQPLLDLAPTDLAPVKRALAERDITRLYADYWLANPITFRNGPKIIASPLESARVAWAQIEVDASKTAVWVVYANSARDRALPKELQRRGISVRRQVDGEIAIYVLDEYLNPAALGDFWGRHRAGK